MMHEGNKGRSSYATGLDVFEEIIEIDVEKQTTLIRKEHTGKYKIPDLRWDFKKNVLEILRSLIHPEDGERYVEFWNIDTMVERINHTPNKMIAAEFRQKKKDGTWGWVRQNMTLTQADDGKRELVLCYVTDIDEEKRLSEEIFGVEGNALLDPITGLPRVNEFFQNVDKFIENNSINGYAMIAAEIEHFKLYNDWYGWSRGNEYLMDIATRLNGVATVLKGFAGYMGGDNFAVFVPHRPEYIEHMVTEIDDYINRVGDMAGFLPNLGLYFVKDGENLSASAMYDRAVLALNEIKGNFIKRYSIYDESMMQEIDREMSVLYEVQKGIENREFVIYFQPQIEIATESIVGAEVLVRWNSKDKGMISPGYFIPVLEKNGFIANLDKYIWEEVCRWQRARLDRGEQTLPVSVNVSRIDAFSLDLEKTFVALTEKYQIPRSCIKIEMTESTYAEDDYKVGKIAEDLRESGFAVYLDDFGSGYSSLNMLKNVGVDVIKIDMQFLNLNEKNAERGEKIMESVVQMTRSLGIPVIIEGAETEQQIKTVTAMGSRYVQGFYYYKPMSESDFDELLKNKHVDYRGFNI